VLHLFWLDLFCLSCVEKERKEEKRKKQLSNPSSLSFSSSLTRPTFFLYTPRPTFSLPLFYFFPALPEQAASPTCSSGPTATAGLLHPLPLSLSLTSRPHPQVLPLPPAASFLPHGRRPLTLPGVPPTGHALMRRPLTYTPPHLFPSRNRLPTEALCALMAAGHRPRLHRLARPSPFSSTL
jgi:hypothetical protein